MAKLIYSLNGSFLGEFTLNKDRITIGRRPSNDIQIDNLVISGEHAVIKVIGRDAFLEDAGSTNGTFVNGKQIQQHILQHDDLIQLGKYQLRYLNDDAAPMAAPPKQKAKTSSPLGETANPAGKQKPEASGPEKPRPSPTPVPAPQPAAHIKILTGGGRGKEMPLNKTVTTLGKPGMQVAVITRRGQGFFLTHVEGQSHPLVNGQAIGLKAHALHDHDVIELAGNKMEFCLA